MNIDQVYEEAYRALEARGVPCPDCPMGPRTHNFNVTRMADGTVKVQPICRYDKSGKLKDVYKRAAYADKDALRETFGRIYIDDLGQTLEEFVEECKKKVSEANRTIVEGREFISGLETSLRTFAESLGVPTSDRGRPYGAHHLLKMLGSTIEHIKKRSKADQEQALEFFNLNQGLAKQVKDLERSNGRLKQRLVEQEAEITRLHALHKTQDERPPERIEKIDGKPQLRVVGTPPPIPATATTK